MASFGVGKIVVITGSNKGIGFEIAQKMAAQGLKTIMTARDRTLGLAAAQSLLQKGYDVEFRRLDIDDLASINEFCHGMAKDHGRCDILINNAAIAYKASDPTPFKDQAEPTVRVNFFGTLELTQAMLPLLSLSSSPRIVTVASQSGYLRILPSEELKLEFSSPELSIDKLRVLMMKFVQDVKSGQHRENGWPNTCYGMSKLGVIAMTRVFARTLPTMSFTCCCPGYCDTDMTSHKGPRPPEHGARTPAMLALLPDKEALLASGKFFLDESPVAWES